MEATALKVSLPDIAVFQNLNQELLFSTIKSLYNSQSSTFNRSQFDIIYRFAFFYLYKEEIFLYKNTQDEYKRKKSHRDFLMQLDSYISCVGESKKCNERVVKCIIEWLTEHTAISKLEILNYIQSP